MPICSLADTIYLNALLAELAADRDRAARQATAKTKLFCAADKKPADGRDGVRRADCVK